MYSAWRRVAPAKRRRLDSASLPATSTTLHQHLYTTTRLNRSAVSCARACYSTAALGGNGTAAAPLRAKSAGRSEQRLLVPSGAGLGAHTRASSSRKGLSKADMMVCRREAILAALSEALGCSSTRSSTAQ